MASDLSTNDALDDEAIATINIIPFVDIVLVLLIVFMVTSTAIVKASLRVELPKAASAGDAVSSTLNIIVTKDGALFLNGQATTRGELAVLVRDHASREPALQAVVAADKHAEYGSVVAIIDLVKQNGVKSFALNLERDANPQGAPL